MKRKRGLPADTTGFEKWTMEAGARYLAENFGGACEHMREQHEAGDKAALMDVVSWCLGMNRQAPQWVVDEFSKRLHLAKAENSYDAAFGRPLGAGKQGRKYLDGLLRARIYETVERIRKEEGAGLSPELFARVGEQVGGLGHTLTSELYYQFRDEELGGYLESGGKDPSAKT